MAVQEKLYTVGEFLEVAQLPENQNRRLELIEGEICEMPSSSSLNTTIAGLFVHYLNAYVVERGLGYISTSDGGYELSPHEVRIPDAAFIAKERVSELGRAIFQAAPNLAVEVIVPGATARMINDKVRVYLNAGRRWFGSSILMKKLLTYGRLPVMTICWYGRSALMIHSMAARPCPDLRCR